MLDEAKGMEDMFMRREGGEKVFCVHFFSFFLWDGCRETLKHFLSVQVAYTQKRVRVQATHTQTRAHTNTYR